MSKQTKEIRGAFMKANRIVWMILIILCITMIGCSSTKSKKEEPTFELKVSFEEVISFANERYEEAPARIKLIYKTAGGEVNHLLSDLSQGEQTWDINTNAVFFGISVEVQNTENTDFEDWVSFGEKFFFNTNYKPDAIGGFFVWHIPMDFTELENVIIVVLDDIFDPENEDRQFIISVNDEEIDLEEVVILGATQPNRPGNIIDDPRPQGQSSNFVLPLNVETLLYQLPTNGSLYEFSIASIYGGGTHNETFGHIEGFAMWRHDFIFTHSDVYWKNPRIYRYRTDTSTATANNMGEYIPGNYDELGSIQMIGDYFYLTYSHSPRRITRHHGNSTASFNTAATFNSGRVGTDTAVGIVEVPAETSYGYHDEWGTPGHKKYIMILAQNNSSYFDIYICKNGDMLTFEYSHQIHSNYSDSHYNNIQLFVDDLNDIWMFGFARQNDYTTYLRAYKLTYGYGPSNQLDKSKNFFDIIETRASKTLIAPDKKDINGAWGASIYYDGEKLNVFISARNAKKSGSDKGRIYYSHWR